MSKLETDLYETRNKLVKEITLLSYNEFNRTPELNKWSIAQVCHHLLLTEKAATNAIVYELKKFNRTKKERKELHLLLDRTKKLKAPRIVEPDTAPFDVQQILDLLNNSRKKLLTLYSTIVDKSILAEKSVKHPAFGELPLDQWFEFLYLHEQRHIEQIKEIKSLLATKH